MNERVLVTGSAGMIGSKVVELLPEFGYVPIQCTRADCDLRDWSRTDTFLYRTGPQYVINCAGWNGGIGFNSKRPAEIYFDNSQIALNVLNASRFNGVRKVVSTITSCAYPEFALSEDGYNEMELNRASPSESVECHGFARRVLDIYSRQLFRQYGFMSVNVVLNNCYGPEDRFDPERSKFIAAMIKKFCDAKRENLKEVTFWGSGKARREVLYRDDAARALIFALKAYNDPIFPLNMGTGKDYKIKTYAKTIAQIVGFEGKIKWDKSKPDGQLKKLLDNRRMKIHIPDFKIKTFLQDGIAQTVKWYNENYDKLKK